MPIEAHGARAEASFISHFAAVLRGRIIRILIVCLAAALMPATAHAQREGHRSGGYSGPADDEISAWTRCISASVQAAPLTDDPVDVVAATYAACAEPRRVMEAAINADPENRITFHAIDVINRLDEIVRPAVAEFFVARLRAAEAEAAPAAQ